MKKKRRQFYVPNTDFWRWSLLTDTFLDVTLKRVRESYQQTESALATLDEAQDELHKVVLHEYRLGTPRLKETVEITYAEIRDERKRILRVQDHIIQEMERIKTEIKSRRSITTRVEKKVRG